MSALMAPIIILVLLATLFALPLSLIAQPANNPTSRITVVGVVYCDTCSTNTFSRHSYFLPGADVHIQCTFKANSPKTREKIEFSVNRTTDGYGIYKLEVPEVDGVDCVEGLAIESVCQASLIGSSSPVCNVPGLKISTNEISVKSKQNNLCIYSLNALSYRPSKKNITLCGNLKEELQNSFNSSKFFLPYFPPYGFPWPPLPNLPPLPSLPPLPPLPSLPPLPPLPSLPPLPPFPSLPFPPLPPFPSLPFPPLPPIPFLPFPHLPFPSPPSLPFPFPSPPSFPFPFPSPPSLPFPFPPLPPFPPTPSLFHPPPPPAFNLGDPRTWIPNIPSLAPPPPPAFNLGDPRTWIPNIPSLAPPPPPAFNLRDPRTWIPYIPPSPPNSPQNQNP